jgi:hypothetical protein
MQEKTREIHKTRQLGKKRWRTRSRNGTILTWLLGVGSQVSKLVPMNRNWGQLRNKSDAVSQRRSKILCLELHSPDAQRKPHSAASRLHPYMIFFEASRRLDSVIQIRTRVASGGWMNVGPMAKNGNARKVLQLFRLLWIGTRNSVFY